MIALGRLLADQPTGLPSGIAERIHGPTLSIGLWTQVGLGLGIVSIMVLKPDVVLSAVIVAVGGIAGWAFASIRSGASASTPDAPSIGHRGDEGATAAG